MGRGLARRGFTLVQLLLVLAIIATLAALSLAAFGRSRILVRRAQCDARVKAVILALDAYRQEHGQYPKHLSDLVDQHYLTDVDALHCPADPNDGDSYAGFYVLRSPQGIREHPDGQNLPMVVCPYHEEESNHGTQAFAGGFTKQFATRPATLISAVGTTVQHPGSLEPISAYPGMVLHGGDRVQTGDAGSAVIRYADNSSSELAAGVDMTVLQTFVISTSGPYYTVLRQSLGTITHRVTVGSKFDVATPTATAGALGTVFTITVNPDHTGILTVTEHSVYVNNLQLSQKVTVGRTTTLPPTSGARRSGSGSGGSGDGGSGGGGSGGGGGNGGGGGGNGGGGDGGGGGNGGGDDKNKKDKDKDKDHNHHDDHDDNDD